MGKPLFREAKSPSFKLGLYYLVYGKCCYKVEQIALYRKGVIGGDSVSALYITVCRALLCEVVVVCSVDSVFIRISQSLHDENCV